MIFMKEKLEKAKNFVYDHKEEIAVMVIGGVAYLVWYAAGKRDGISSCENVIHKIFKGHEDDLVSLAKAHNLGVKKGYSAFYNHDAITLGELANHIINSNINDNSSWTADTVIHGVVILGK